MMEHTILEAVMVFLVLVLAVVLYAGFVCVRLGVHQRLPLALAPISLDRIPDRAARSHGDRPLFTTDEPCGWTVPVLAPAYPDPTAWSAVRIRATAAHVAGMLNSLGVCAGDRVAVVKRNHLDIHVLCAAIVRAGAIACPINNQLDGESLANYIDHIGARVIITDVETLRRVLAENTDFGALTTVVLADRRTRDAESIESSLRRASGPRAVLHWIEEALQAVHTERAPVARDRDDVLYLVHSSGTTGFPKAVMLKNAAQSHAVRGWLCYVHLSRTRDRGYVAVPNNHQAVMLTFYSTLLLGLPVHWTTPYARNGFDAKRVVRELADGQFTGFFGFPVTYTQLKEVDLSKFDLRRMKFWATTADASHETIQRQFAAVGGAFWSVGLPFDGSVYLDAQGSSEVGTPSVIRYVTRFTTKFERRIGKPGSTPFGPAVRVATPEGDEARKGCVGRLEVRGRTLLAGYWNNEELFRQVTRHGWFFTGDVACYGRDGHIVQLDREVDVIHTRRGPVFSLPIEEIVHRHPAVFDACVYGARQQDGTQLPAAAIALRSGYTLNGAALRAELNRMLPASRRLSAVTVMQWSDFPMGVTGKTLKRVFRERSERQALIRPAAVARRS